MKNDENFANFQFFLQKKILFENGDLDSLMPVSKNQMLIFGINDPHPGDGKKGIIEIMMPIFGDHDSENFYMGRLKKLLNC
jgi:hypothetical protein